MQGESGLGGPVSALATGARAHHLSQDGQGPRGLGPFAASSRSGKYNPHLFLPVESCVQETQHAGMDREWLIQVWGSSYFSLENSISNTSSAQWRQPARTFSHLGLWIPGGRGGGG